MNISISLTALVEAGGKKDVTGSEIICEYPHTDGTMERESNFSMQIAFCNNMLLQRVIMSPVIGLEILKSESQRVYNVVAL